MSNDTIGTFVRECQLFAGRSSVPNPIDARRADVHEFVSRLPSPKEPLETFVLTGLLFDVALHWSHDVHAQHHAGDLTGCGFDPSSHFMHCWRYHTTAPVIAFGEWAASFLDLLERSHRRPPAVRARAIVDATVGHRLNTKMLARETGCHPARLRALFKREYGMSIREYQTRRQILEATRLLVASDLKVDAAARAAGFSSRKNFYDAFWRILRTHPSAVRRWSPSDFENLSRQLLPAGLQP